MSRSPHFPSDDERTEMAETDPVGWASDGEHPAADSTTVEKKDGAIRGIHGAEEPEYATGLRLTLIMFTILVSTLLTALEIGIIAIAIPGITDEYHQLDDIGWYESATFLLSGASSPVWGKVYKYTNAKYTYLVSIVLYLIGSVVAAAAPNSTSVIVGRALQGLGASGTLGGSVLIINYVSHPMKHAVLIGTWMAVFMASTILGPVIGGALTSGASWRWCFWINLPLGGLILVLVLLFLRIPRHIHPAQATWKEIFLQLDLPGFVLFLASLICLTLAMQWGGQSKPWSDGSTIATLVLWVCLTIAFFAVEWFQGPRAMIPVKLLKSRITWTNVLYCLVSNSALYQVMFYLPIYFQSIKGNSAITSGVNTLPFLAFFALAAMTSGAIIGKTRHLQPYQLTSSLLMTAGMGIFYTLDVDSSKARYIGAEVIFGFGIGLGNQVPMTAVQGFAKPEDVASSTGIMLMCQSSSAAYFLVVSQCLFNNRMLQTIKATAPNIDASQLLKTGASVIQHAFIGGDLAAVLHAYMIGIKDIFIFSLATSAFSALLAFAIPYEKLPDHEDRKSEETVGVV